MDRQRILLWTSITVGVIVVGLILYLIFRPSLYNELLINAEKAIKQNPNTTINYYVVLEGTNQDSFKGFALYDKVGDSEYWNNNLTLVNGSIFQLSPLSLIDLMKRADSYAVESYQGNLSCSLLNAFITDATGYNTLGPYDYVRVMACLDKKTGYPVQYSIMVVGEITTLVSYNSLTFRAFIPQINESTKPIINESVIGNLSREQVKEALGSFENVSSEEQATIDEILSQVKS